MKIKTRLNLLTIFFLSVLIISGALSLFMLQRLRQVEGERDLCLKILEKTFDLNILSHEYLFKRSERCKVQWHKCYKAIEGSLRPVFCRPEENAVLSEITAAYQRAGATFSDLELNLKKETQVHGEELALLKELDLHLIGRLSETTQTIVSRALQLRNMTMQEARDIEQRFIFLSIAVLLILFAAAAVNSFLLGRRLIQPIIRLHKGAEIIGAGNLDYKVGTNEKDEIGQLSRAFDRMVGNLKKKNLELQNRIGELERFHDATVDRELRIKELRDRIEELEAKIRGRGA